MKNLITEGNINLKLHRYADKQYKRAFENGTKEAWKKFQKDVDKMIDYLNKDITEINKTIKREAEKIAYIDKRWFWAHY